MNKENEKTEAAKALELLDQAWAYYVSEPKVPAFEEGPELFEYANAA